MRGFLAIVLTVLAATAMAADEVYRHVAPDGTVHYMDRPPHKGAKPMRIDPPPGAKSGRKTFYSPEALRAAARFAVSVESPTPGQVLRTSERAVAAASVMPGLVTGFRLRYLLDDRAVTPEPVDTLSLLLPALDPGPYRLSIAVLDGQGREVARSPATEFRVVAP